MAGSEAEKPVGVEPEPSPREAFLDRAYDASVARYSALEGVMATTHLPPTRIENFDYALPHPQGPTVDLPADIQKGVILEDKDYSRGFALTNRIRSRYDWTANRGFLFGIMRKKEGLDWEVPRNLRLLFHLGYRADAGEVYIDDFGRLNTDGWADERIRGGRNFGGWEAARQIQDEGIEAVLDFIDRTFTQSSASEMLRRERIARERDTQS